MSTATSISSAIAAATSAPGRLRVACTVDTCDIDSSFYLYRISLAANALFVALFSLSLLGYLVVFALNRRAVAFTISLVLGVVCELVGYVARILSWKDQWAENPFLAQIITLTLGPAFISAGIYFCLKRVIYIYGEENSRIKARLYPFIFIPCDVVALVLQAVGGGMAAVALHTRKSLDVGNNIMIAGLVFQVVTIAVFIGFATDFALQTRRRVRAAGAEAALNQNPRLVEIRNSFAFKGTLAALALASVLILWRSIFRAVELAGGWTGEMMRKQGEFHGMESTMIAVACLLLNVFHPSLGLKEMIAWNGEKKVVDQASTDEEKTTTSN